MSREHLLRGMVVIVFSVKAVFFPLCGVIIHVSAYGMIFLCTAHDAVVIRTLEQGIAEFFCDESFKGFDELRDGICRGRCPHRPALGWGKNDRQVNMIRHDHIAVNTGDAPDIFLSDFPNCRQLNMRGDVGIAPYNCTEQRIALLDAERYKIRAFPRIVISS